MKKHNVHFFQHVPFEGLGLLEDILYEAGVRLSRTALWQADPVWPEPSDTDLLIVMGGPMGVYETDAYPWLASEIACLQRFIQAGKPVLGICLGAQLLAAALGSRVYPSGKKEIGWFEISCQNPRPDWFFPHTEQPVVYHWHGDTFDLPPGAVSLASSLATENQAFAVGEHLVGLQFHLETDARALEAFLETGSQEIEASPGPWVMPIDQQRAAAAQAETNRPVLVALINHLLKRSPR